MPDNDTIPPLPKGYVAKNDGGEIPPLPKGYVDVKKKVGGGDNGINQNNGSQDVSTQQSEFANAQKPTGTISKDQVSQAQQHINAIPNRSTEQTIASGTPLERDIIVSNKGQYSKDQINAAAVNTAENYFKNNPQLTFNLNKLREKNDISLKNIPQKDEDKFSLKNLKNTTSFQRKVAEIKTAFENGDLALTNFQNGEKAGEPIFTKPAKFLRGIGQAIEGSFGQTKDAVINMSHSDKGFADYLDNQKRDLPEIPTEAPSGVSNWLGQQVGGLIKPIAEFGAGTALTSSVGGWGGFAALAADLIPSTTTAKTKELYYEKMQDLKQQYGDDIPESERINAIKQAKSRAVTEAIPEEALQMYLFGRAGGLHNASASGLEAFRNSLAKAGVDIPKFAVLGGLSEATSQGIAALTGNDTPDAKKRIESAIQEWATMEAMFKVVHGVTNVPKYLKSSAKESYSKLSPEIQESLTKEAIAKGWVTKEQADQTQADLNEYQGIRNTLPENLSHEKAAGTTGLLQQNKHLKEEKEKSNPILHDDIDAEIDANEVKAKQILNSNQPLKHETDHITGERGQDIGGRPTKEESEAKKEPIIQGDGVVEPTVKPTDEGSKTEKGIGEVVQPQPEKPTLSEAESHIQNLEDDKEYTAYVTDVNEIPENLRDRAQKVSGEIKTRKSFLGIPYGKETTINRYRYTFTGKEAKEEFAKQQPKEDVGEDIQSQQKGKTDVINNNGNYTFKQGDTAADVVYNEDLLSDDLPSWAKKEVYLDHIERAGEKTGNNTTKGTGKKVINDIIQHFKKEGADILTLRADNGMGFSTLKDNKLYDYYKSIGFKDLKEGVRNGQMYLDLREPTAETKPNSVEDNTSILADEKENKQPIEDDFTAKGGNKVVDEKGEPIVLYHGTTSQFKGFDENKFGGIHLGTRDAANQVSQHRSRHDREIGTGKKIELKPKVIAAIIKGDKIKKVEDVGTLHDWQEVLNKYPDYDVFEYVNKNEDKGSVSYMVRSRNNIKEIDANEPKKTKPIEDNKPITDKVSALEEQKNNELHEAGKPVINLDRIQNKDFAKIDDADKIKAAKQKHTDILRRKKLLEKLVDCL